MNRQNAQRIATAALLLATAAFQWACSDAESKSEDHDPATEHSHRTISNDDLDAAADAIDEYLQGGEIEKAEAIARRLLSQAPSNSLSHEMLARVLLQKAANATESGTLELAADTRREAARALSKAANLMDIRADLHQSAGELNHAIGELDKAAWHYTRAGELDRANPKPRFFAAQLLMAQGRHEHARTLLQEALQLQPDEPFTTASLAMVELELGDSESALKHIVAARQLAPDDLQIRALKARIHRRLSQPNEAVNLLIGLDDRERAQPSVARELALSLTELEEYALAAAAWSHRVQFGPTGDDIDDAMQHAAEAYIQDGNLDQAAYWIQRLESRRGGESGVVATLRDMAKTKALDLQP